MNYETELPELIGECPPDCDLCYESCPGRDIPMPDLDRMTFGRQRNTDEELLGIGQEFIKCHAVDPLVRASGASGGLVSALLIYALENDVIDAAIVVGMDDEQPWRAVPRIAATKQEVIAAAQTKENLVPVNSILAQALESGFKRLGIVGLPCHVHAIRKMQLFGRPEEILNAIKFVIGLVCGTNYSYRGNEHIIEEECKVPLAQVAKVEFRGGEYPGDFRVTTKDGKTVTFASPLRRAQLRAFLNDRCAMCYDYANDLADVSVGDYFAPEMRRGVPGLSAAIMRTETGKKLVKDAELANYISTQPIDRDNFFRGLFEQKKHGGAFHILKRREYGWETPDYHLPLEYPSPMRRKLFLGHPYLTGAGPGTNIKL
jgi:coenzyme F420 hydrogenase subunit beta